MVSVLVVYIIQVPCIYVTYVHIILLFSQVVIIITLPKFLLENTISVLLCPFILFRIDNKAS